jgi:hypothetical protein
MALSMPVFKRWPRRTASLGAMVWTYRKGAASSSRAREYVAHSVFF